MFARFTEDGRCRAVSHPRLDATPRGSDVAPRQGVTVAAPVQTGSHRTRLAFVREGFQRRRAPESHSPLPSPGPASVPCLPPPGARPLSLISPVARRGRRNRGPGCSLGACAVRAWQSRDKAPCSASHPHSSQPRWTPSLRLWGSPRLLGLHSPSLPSSPAGARRTQALVRRFVVASAASFLLGGLARSRHFKYHL